MVCPKCNSENVVIEREKVSEKTKGKTSAKSNGCLWSLGRGCLIVFTFGLWLIFGKRRGSGKLKSKTKLQHNTVALCQSCGNTWIISRG